MTLFILLISDTKLYGSQDGTGAAPARSCSCPRTGDLTSSACIHVCGCVVDGVSATAAT